MSSTLNDMENNRSTDREKPRVGSPELHPLMALNTPGTVEIGNGANSRTEKEKNPEVFTNIAVSRATSGIDDGFLTPAGAGDVPGVPISPRHPDREGSDERERPFAAPFPPTPGFPPEPEKIPRGRGGVDINVYAHKKTLAQGMMDLALLSANANQLRYVLDTGSDHPYFYVGLVLISSSIFLQVAVGIGLILNSRYNIRHIRDVLMANKINNFTVLGIFLVTMMNVFISAFGVGHMPSDPTVRIPPERLSQLIALNCTE
ncbi:ninjurin-A-like isoform X2 [Ischnura elegans]|uniref:ninjurin-A-like isoform X2 n=1 Tax=Ischnura elegans TaxID=197161 RepID=UPI001ED8BC36|nr:ninjurin-A-like isoform X2 [Ischnura elegans]